MSKMKRLKGSILVYKTEWQGIVRLEVFPRFSILKVKQEDKFVLRFSLSWLIFLLEYIYESKK